MNVRLVSITQPIVNRQVGEDSISFVSNVFKRRADLIKSYTDD